MLCRIIPPTLPQLGPTKSVRCCRRCPKPCFAKEFGLRSYLLLETQWGGVCRSMLAWLVPSTKTVRLREPRNPELPGCTGMGATCSTGRVSELVLLGSGVSTALPRISCVLRGRLDGPRDGSTDRPPQFVTCEVCRRGMLDPFSPNRRCNVSALVRLDDVSILIDCGKTAREAWMRHLPNVGVKVCGLHVF